MGRSWLSTDYSKAWLKEDFGKAWLNSEWEKAWVNGDFKSFLNGPFGKAWLEGDHGRVWLEGDFGKAWLNGDNGKAWLMSDFAITYVNDTINQAFIDGNEISLMYSSYGKAWLETDHGKAWVLSDFAKAWLNNEWNKAWLDGDYENFLNTELGRAWLETDNGRGWIIEDFNGKAWLNDEWDRVDRRPYVIKYHHTDSANVTKFIDAEKLNGNLVVKITIGRKLEDSYPTNANLTSGIHDYCELVDITHSFDYDAFPSNFSSPCPEIENIIYTTYVDYGSLLTGYGAENSKYPLSSIKIGPTRLPTTSKYDSPFTSSGFIRAQRICKYFCHSLFTLRHQNLLFLQ
eukprot:Awhi_evm2s14960